MSRSPVMSSASSSPPRRPSPTQLHDDDDFPVFTKRRKMNLHDERLETTEARQNTPSPLNDLYEKDAADRALQHSITMAAFCRESPDSSAIDSSMASSCRSSPLTSPAVTRKDYRLKYTKHELWASIESDYQYLMDEEIIETCKSTESDLSWESDEVSGDGKKVSFTEFLQQYKELSDWLDSILRVTQRQSSSHSERYLNQSYYEEMLHNSPRKKLFNDYARQLQRRYPSMKEEINIRITHVNSQWQALEMSISPLHNCNGQPTLLADLESDLCELQKWLTDAEETLPGPSQQDVSDWSHQHILTKLQHHQGVQAEIEARSGSVSAVLRLCERLAGAGHQEHLLQTRAQQLERRWHALWLNSLEWQCRLEEALSGTRHRRHYGDEDEEKSWLDDDDGASFATSTTQTDLSLEDSTNTHLHPTIDTKPDQRHNNLSKELARDSSKLMPKSLSFEEFYEDQGIDSALGRSVSDQSLFKEFASNQKKQQASGTMLAAHEIFINSDRKHMLQEIHDIGYSSESHSNEDGELSLGLPVETSSPFLGKKFMTSNKMCSQESSNVSQVDLQFNTSADTVKDVCEERENARGTSSHLDMSPNQSFYCMTMIESLTDTEPSSAAERREIHSLDAYDEVASDAESEFSKSADLSVEDLPFDTNLKSFEEKLCKDIGSSDGEKSSVHAMSVSGSGESIHDPTSCAVPKAPNDNAHINEQQQLHNLKVAFNDYLESQKYRSHHSFDDDRRPQCDVPKRGNSSPEYKVHDSIDELISSVEQLVHKPDNQPPLASRKELSKSKPINIPIVSRSIKLNKLNDSFTSTDGSVRQTDDACDASAEGSCSESENDFSTASSDSDNLEVYSGLTSVNTTLVNTGNKRQESATLVNNCMSLPSSPFKPDCTETFNHQHLRPKSMTELNKNFEQVLCPRLSLSEGAIHELCCNTTRGDRFLDGSPFNISRKLKRKKFRRPGEDLDNSGFMGQQSGRLSPISRRTKRCEKSALLSDELLSISRKIKQKQTKKPRSPTLDLFEEDQKKMYSNFNVLSSESDLPTTLNSTMESSEQAWDNYQEAPYTSVSEDPTEEKLDASHLAAEWEHNLDFEEDFHLDTRFGCGISGTSAKDNLKSNHPEQKGPYLASSIEESDSDLDDFKDVMEESQKAMQFTQNTLRKQHKDPMGTGILYDPSEYSEPLATCHTNMKCLEEVVLTLQTEAGVSTQVGHHDIHQALHMISEWQQLESLARTRLAQSQQLASMYSDMRTAGQALGQARVALVEADLQYDSPRELEHAIKGLQHVTQDILRDKTKLEHCEEMVSTFSAQHPTVNMHHFAASVKDILAAVKDVGRAVTERAREQHAGLLAWHELAELQRELAYFLHLEQQQLMCAEIVRSLPDDAINEGDISNIQHDLELLQSELEEYETKLKRMHTLCDDFSQVVSYGAHQNIIQNVVALDARATFLRQHSQELLSVLSSRKLTLVRTSPQNQSEENMSAHGRRHNTLPLKIALVGVMGLFFLLKDSASPQDAGIIFSPQLRYVKGPPPT